MRTVWSVWYPWIKNHPDYLRGVQSVHEGRILVARMLVELTNISFAEAIHYIKVKEINSGLR